jgi:ferritin-like metal-binding protein YciE
LIFSVNGTNQRSSRAEDSTPSGAGEAAAAFRCQGVSRQCRLHRSTHRRYHITKAIDPVEIQVAVIATTSQTAGIRATESADINHQSASARYRKETHMSVKTIDELLLDELKDLYSAEMQITKALPKMAKAVTSQELRGAFESHLEETEGHVDRLDKIFDILGKSPRGKTCQGMKGLLEEGSEMMHELEKGPIRDAALISAAQRVEHYEMAGYGSVREFATLLGQSEIASLLDKTLEEEKATDEKLTGIAKEINPQALKSNKAA